MYHLELVCNKQLNIATVLAVNFWRTVTKSPKTGIKQMQSEQANSSVVGRRGFLYVVNSSYHNVFYIFKPLYLTNSDNFNDC